MASYVWREWYMVICVSLHHLTTGFISAFPAVIIPAITANSTGINATKEEASWFTASYGLTGPIGYLIWSPIMQKYGRRATYVLITTISSVGFITIAEAGDVPTLMAGRCIQGISFGALHISCIIVAEYVHPKRRGFFLVFKITFIVLGEFLCHGLGAMLTWRQISWLAAVPSALCAIGTLKWTESPAWFAYKGRYEECAQAFEWIRGKDREARMELKELLSAQQQIREMNKTSYGDTFMATINAFRSKEFLKPFFILAASTVLFLASGTYYLSPYCIEIMVKMTGDTSKAFYFTLGFDVMKVVAVLLSSFIIWRFNRRIILFSCGSISFVFLGLLCIFHYLDRIGVTDFIWLTPCTLMIYFFLVCISIVPVAVVNKGELFPLECRGIGVCSIGILFSLITMLTLKITSNMLLVLDVHGTFAVYLVICVFMLIILYFILPETKDRTMQDIETDFIDLKLNKDDDGSDLDVIGSLVKSGSSIDVNK